VITLTIKIEARGPFLSPSGRTYLRRSEAPTASNERETCDPRVPEGSG
jgi:hypothetical protein